MDRVVIFYARLRANDPKAILAYRRLKGLAPTDPRCAAILAKLRRLAAASMAQLNRYAAEVGKRYSVHACTDITGFGLLGHAYEMAVASGVDMIIESSSIPWLPEASDAASMGLIPAGAYANREYLKQINMNHQVPANIQDLCFDPQTSGGLLFSIPAEEANAMLKDLKAAGITAAACIGSSSGKGKGNIRVC